MGTWGTGIYESDSALDMMGELDSFLKNKVTKNYVEINDLLPIADLVANSNWLGRGWTEDLLDIIEQMEDEDVESFYLYADQNKRREIIEEVKDRLRSKRYQGTSLFSKMSEYLDPAAVPDEFYNPVPASGDI